MTDIVAIAMRAAWDRLELRDKQAGMAEQEQDAFTALAQQLNLPVDEVRRRAALRCSDCTAIYRAHMPVKVHQAPDRIG